MQEPIICNHCGFISFQSFSQPCPFCGNTAASFRRCEPGDKVTIFDENFIYGFMESFIAIVAGLTVLSYSRPSDYLAVFTQVMDRLETRRIGEGRDMALTGTMVLTGRLQAVVEMLSCPEVDESTNPDMEKVCLFRNDIRDLLMKKAA